jgi:hypothetical protein
MNLNLHQLTISHASQDDANALAGIYVQSLQRIGYSGFTPDRKGMSKTLRNQNLTHLVARIDERPVGYLFYSHEIYPQSNENYIWIDEFYTTSIKSYRVGTDLLNHLLQNEEEQPLYLHARRHPKTINWYQTKGFQLGEQFDEMQEMYMPTKIMSSQQKVLHNTNSPVITQPI